MFVRPRRSATIRTRLDVEAIRERLGALAQNSGSTGMQRFLSHGYFQGGGVGLREFHLDYHYNNPKNPQTYDVHGAIFQTPDWRLVRLKLRAHSPWLSAWTLAGIVGMLGFNMAYDGLPLKGALGVLIVVVGVLAFANLLYIPDAVTSRVSSLLASELRGSVRQGTEWVVPGD